MFRWQNIGSISILGLLLTACNGQTATLAAINQLDSAGICTVDHSSGSATFLVLIGAGLLTGFSHCVGMCGPLVSAFAMRRRAAGQEISTPLVLFQIGRLTTYLLLGAAMGVVGQVLASTIRTWQGALSISLGAMMVLVGLSLLGFIPLQKWLTGLGFASRVGQWIRHLMTSNSPAAPLGLGLANGLLPCGPVYAMALLAATSGNPLGGAFIMLIFGLGTLPAMLGMGFSSALLSVQLRTYLYRAAALLVVLVGVQLALRGLAFSGQLSHATLGSVMLW